MARLWIGSYGDTITVVTLDHDTGEYRLETAASTPNPSFLAYAPRRRVLYAVNERSPGTISAFAVRGDGRLTPLGVRSSHGDGPCHLHVHPSGRYLLATNYGSGSVAVYPMRDDGSLDEASDVVRHSGSGPDPDRQRAPHPHQVQTDPSGRYVLVVDLGADRVVSYRLVDGRLQRAAEWRGEPGAGPRHLAFHPSGRLAFISNELASSMTVCAYADGTLTPVQTLPAAPQTDVRNYPSEVLVSGDGRCVYLANRGHDSIARFVVDAGRLVSRDTVSCSGAWPRHISLSPDGRFLYAANQTSGDVAVLPRHPDGSLAAPVARIPVAHPTMVLPMTGAMPEPSRSG